MSINRRIFTAGLGASLLAGCAAVPNSRPPAVISIESGDLQGVQEGGLTVYRGVPFAAPPTGPRRWRAPQPLAPWTGVRMADQFAPRPAQNGESLPGAPAEPMSEDCLYLNIWTPAVSSSDQLPVIVWLYGGGFANGSASIPAYWGDALARKGVVVVNVAYRVGAFGYFAHPELTREAGEGEAANFGLLDQITALEWVQRNISAFGGDPGRVTLMGQSAGSMAVCLLMAAPRAKGLFHRGIGQSGGVFFPFSAAPPALREAWSLPGAEKSGEKLAGRIGASSLAALRAAPAEQILKEADPGAAHPVFDGHLLPDEPRKIFAEGRQARVPVLIGSNSDEARSLITVRVRAETFAEDFARAFLPLPPELMSLYPTATDEEAYGARAALERDLRFGWDMRAWARLHASAAPVFMYHFSRTPPFSPGSPLAGDGACHWAELPYVFDQLDQWPGDWTDEDRRLASRMAGYWVNFAAHGDPNAGAVTWPAYEPAGEQVMLFGDTVKAGTLPNQRALDLFDDAFGVKG